MEEMEDAPPAEEDSTSPSPRVQAPPAPPSSETLRAPAEKRARFEDEQQEALPLEHLLDSVAEVASRARTQALAQLQQVAGGEEQMRAHILARMQEELAHEQRRFEGLLERYRALSSIVSQLESK